MPPFFDDYTPYCEQIRNGQFSRAVDDGLSLLKHIKQFEPKKYLTEPKGTPFYWLGIAAFASHDYQTATFFFDAAVSEDLIHHRGDKNQPALLFMRLDENLAEQAALPIVHKIVARLEDAIDDYKARLDSDALTMGDVREYFLNHLNHPTRPNLRSLTTTFVSFVAEWDYRESMIDLSQEGSKEPFFTHLFRAACCSRACSRKTRQKWSAKQQR